MLAFTGEHQAHLAFLANSHDRADSKLVLAAVSGPALAGESLWAVLLVHARAVRAVTVLDQHVEEAAEGLVTIRVRAAFLLVGEQTLAFTRCEHGDETHGLGG
jgi:hypothetical protein